MPSRRNQCPGCWFDGLQLAGFQLTITGRFWVSTEATGMVWFAGTRFDCLPEIDWIF